MAYEFTLGLVPFAVAICCLCVPLVFTRRITDERKRLALVVWTVPIVVWALAILFRLSATTIPQERLWHNIRFIGPAFGAVGYLLFSAAYTNHVRWFRRRRLAGLFAIPVVTTVFLWTPPVSGLVVAAVRPAVSGPFVAQFVHGPWYFVHASYSYGLILLGTVWLVRRLWEFRERSLFRGQIATVLFAVVSVVVANGAFNLELTTIDYTPIAGAFTAIIFTIAATEYRLFDVSPLAREIVVSSMENGMVVANADDEIIDANDAATAILDTEVDSLIGRQLSDLFVDIGEDTDSTIDHLADSQTIQIHSPEGLRYYDVSVSTITDPSGSDVGRVATFSEVTDRVDRQQRLREQKRVLERQNERLDQFTSMVSHDLRNPLSIASGHLELARETDEDSHLEQIERALDRMDTIVDSLLTVAQAETIVEETEPVSLAECATTAWQTAQTGTADLQNDFQGDTVDANPKLLRHIFENLFRNAADHCDEPLSVRVGRLDGGFFVEDNGPGIPVEMREEIFEQGYTTSEDGLGIGLAIVREFVDAHSWEITVTDGREGGARFEILTE